MCDLVEETGGAEPFQTACIAVVSMRSLKGVPVPWQLT